MPPAKTTKKSAANGLVITLRRSPIGTPQKHRRVLSGLGLRKIRQTVTRPDTPQVRGMIGKIGYLLEVQPQ
jgi:large subunit ribosomal protein L30